MIGSEFVTGLIAILIGYLLGSIPTAYIVTRIKTGKDIRQLGGGNVGGLNTYKEVGRLAGIIVAAVDCGKGAATVAITYYALRLNQPYVLISACGAILGHNWMVWLKCTGGKGMGAAFGAMLIVLPVYGHTKELLIFIGIVLLPLLLTQNVALSMGIGLLALPFLSWLSMHSGQFVIWTLVVGLIIAVKFTPTALAALAKSKNLKDFIKGH